MTQVPCNRVWYELNFCCSQFILGQNPDSPGDHGGWDHSQPQGMITVLLQRPIVIIPTFSTSLPHSPLHPTSPKVYLPSLQPR